MTTPKDYDLYPAFGLQNVEILRPVLESAIQHPFTGEVFRDEVEEVLSSVKQSNEGLSDRYYLVAESAGGIALGMMGLAVPSEAMRSFATSNNPVELVNAFVLESSRGAGVGRALAGFLEKRAKDVGYTELIVNSGPRYRFSGWPFWTKLYGEPIAVAKDYYGPNFDAMVWQKSLKNTK